MIRDSREHHNQDADQTADGQGEWQSHANKSSDTHLDGFCVNECGVGSLSECVAIGG
jgi:hypothetical protein